MTGLMKELDSFLWDYNHSEKHLCWFTKHSEFFSDSAHVNVGWHIIDVLLIERVLWLRGETV